MFIIRSWPPSTWLAPPSSRTESTCISMSADQAPIRQRRRRLISFRRRTPRAATLFRNPRFCACPALTCNFSPQSERILGAGLEDRLWRHQGWRFEFLHRPERSGRPAPALRPEPQRYLPLRTFRPCHSGEHTRLSAPAAGSISGVADLPGGDLMVTLGLWRSD